MKQFWLKHRIFLVGGLVWVSIFGLYASSAARTMTGFGDSDELISAGYTLSVAHPPGYPLLTYLIYIATHMPFISPGVGAQLLASLLMSLAMLYLFKSGVRLFMISHKKIADLHLGIIALAVVMTATSSLIWEHGTYIEVFALNALLAMALVNQTLIVADFKTRRSLMWWGLIAGLGLSHHQTFILVFGPLLATLWWQVFRKKRDGTKSAMMVMASTMVVFLVCYGTLVFIGRHQSPFSWQFIPSLSGLIHFYLRSDFSGYSSETGTLSAWFAGFSWSESFRSLIFYVTELWQQWGVVLAFGLLGIGLGKKSLKQWYWPLLMVFLASGPVLASLITLPLVTPMSVDDELNRAMVERMYVLSEVGLGIFVMFGLAWVVGKVTTRMGWYVLGMGGLVVLFNIVTVFPERSLASYSAANAYIEQLLTPLPASARLVCLSDLSCFGLDYAQGVLHKSPGVAVISTAPQLRYTALTGRKDLAQFDYPDNPYRIGEIVGYATSHQFPLAIAQLNSYWATTLGLNGEAFWLTPQGYTQMVERDPTRVSDTYRPDYIASTLIAAHPEWLQHRYVRVLRAILTEQHAISATLLARMSLTNLAIREIKIGLAMEPQNPTLVDMTQTLGSYPGDPRYESTPNERTYEDTFKKCQAQHDEVCMIQADQQLVWRNPADIQFRVTLAQLLENAGVLPLAKREYEHTLSLDPANKIATAAMDRLHDIPDLSATLP